MAHCTVSMKKGIDTSRYNTGLDFKTAKAHGYEFIIPRDGYGTDAVDPFFLQTIGAAKAYGIDIAGVYHWIDGRSVADAKKNALCAIKNVKAAGLPADTVIWCDLEFTPEQQKERGLSYADMKAMAVAFCDTCLSNGYPTGIYTNQAGLVYIYGKDIIKQYDIWLADYEGEAFCECVYRQTKIAKIGGIAVDVDEYYGQYTAGTAKPKKGGATKVRYIKKLIPAKTYVDGALKLLKTRKLEYNNKAPYNCGYCHSDMRISGDCWCINPKTMVWSISMGKPVWDNRTVGFYYYTDGINASGLPDWDGQSLLNGFCEDISFKKMRADKIAPALLLNSNATHMGAYIGDFQLSDGNTYNTMEFTPASGISPKMASYVDDNGARRVCKGGRVVSYWARAGRMTGIIDYANNDNVTPPQPTKPYTIDNLAVHIMRGDFGTGDARKKAIKNLGYTDAEINKAQDIVNDIYAAHEMDKLAADLAMKFISGEAGDGVTMRRQWIADNYKTYDTEKLFRAVQDKVNAYIPS